MDNGARQRAYCFRKEAIAVERPPKPLLNPPEKKKRMSRGPVRH